MKAEYTTTSQGLIDIHVHLVALPDGKNGCRLSSRFKKKLFWRLMARRYGIDFNRPAEANTNYLASLCQQLKDSKRVSRVVLLALDGVYDGNGVLDQGRTEALISNAYVLEAARKYPEVFMAGVSINPQRRDALEELERSVDKGAVLVKALPNSQAFDPANRKYVPFYRALAEHRIPFLCHVGHEFSVKAKDQKVGDPQRLRVALDEGVSVIAAHSCSSGLGWREPYFETFIEFAMAYSNFYADTSALTLPNRVRTLFLLRRHPELHSRLFFGTDYPLPVFSYPALFSGSVTTSKNVFDRQSLVLESLGVEPGDFSVFLGKRD